MACFFGQLESISSTQQRANVAQLGDPEAMPTTPVKTLRSDGVDPPVSVDPTNCPGGLLHGRYCTCIYICIVTDTCVRICKYVHIHTNPCVVNS